MLAIMEHNRWNVEKLLLGYSKPRPEEDKYAYRKEFENKPGYSKEIDDKLNENRRVFIHHDIRPFEDLDDIVVNDIKLTQHIPWILKTVDKI